MILLAKSITSDFGIHFHDYFSLKKKKKGFQHMHRVLKFDTTPQKADPLHVIHVTGHTY